MDESSCTLTVQRGSTVYTIEVQAEIAENFDLRLTCIDDRGARADVVLCFDNGDDPLVSAKLTRADRQP